jgi:hypothetical protein
LKLKQYLQEEYIGHINEFEIFTNPSVKELSEFNNFNIRFIADNRTKRFFIVAANVLHEYLVNYLRRNKLIDWTDNTFMGTGTVKSLHIEFEDFSYDWGKPQKIDDFKWTMKYFTDSSKEKLWNHL